jgi:ribosome-associated toxin RatA of RatAB toxin-antitoxin module
MTHIVKRSALVPFSAQKMYELVADIPRYPEFLKWCSSAEVVDENEGEVIASLKISFKGLKKSFTTRNRMSPGHRIDMSLVAGPFSQLEGQWLFTALDDNASKIELAMNFDFDNVAVATLVGPVFSFIANHQVDAFNQRAQALYGD